jgi:tryptophanyl-tRNA synthetase
LARKFNNRFGKTFTEPQALLTKTPRIMSLANPEKKMSKTMPSGCLFLDDLEKDIEKKIKTSVTDSGSEIKYDLEKKPGISNLLSIYEALSGEPIGKLEKKYTGKGYGQFKADLIKVVVDSLAPFRKTKTLDSKLKTILDSGAKKAEKIASKKMAEVKEKLGLLN